MRLVIALIILLTASVPTHAQGIVYFSYGAGVWVGDDRSRAPISEFSMDLNGDGVNDFRFVGTDAFVEGFSLQPQAQSRMLGYGTTGNPMTEVHAALRLVANEPIASTAPFNGTGWFGRNPNPNNSRLGLYLISCFGGCGGDFARANSMQTEGYVGVQFFASDGLHYGWIRVRGGNGNDGRILDYAYNTEPGQSIAAGAVPEPSTWALLGLGLAALCLLRKRSSV